MHIEIDQSGKIEQMNKDSYIAFSNHEQYCIKLPRKIKREITFRYRSKVRQLIQRMFSICIYHCLTDYVSKIKLIIIDQEYPGWEADIKTYLIPLLRSKHNSLDKNIIQFGLIGKKSRAHEVAKSAFIGKIKPNKILNTEDILKWLK